MGQKIDLTQQVQGILPEANGGAGLNIGLRFSDAETPSGTINGSNKTFTLAFAPFPSLSLLLFLSKTLQIQGTDYTLSANTISMIAAPSGSPSFLCWYRYVGFGQVLMFSEGLVMSEAFSIDAPASQLPLGPIDQLTFVDQLALFMDTSIAPFSDQLVMSDLIQLFESPGLLLIEDLLTLSDSDILNFVYRKQFSDTIILSEIVAKTLFVVSELVSDQFTFHDILLYQLAPVAYQFGQAITLLDAFAFLGQIPLSISDLMTALQISDPFTATLSSAWTQITGTFAYDGSTGLEMTARNLNGFAIMSRNDVTFATAQKTQFTVLAEQSAGVMPFGPVINAPVGSAGGYLFNCPGAFLRIARIDSTTFETTLASVVGSIADGDIISIENDGSGHLTARKNGTSILTATDTTYTGGTVGVTAGSATIAGADRVINFVGGALVAAGMVESVTEILS